MLEPLGPIEICLRLLAALGLCALIGFEREARDHAAGLRTNMLVGLAAATFAIINALLVAELDGIASGEGALEINVDPLRLIEAVTGGVAFLAAGLIIFARGRVRGLTTGASMWLSAAIGLASGLGQWVVAVPATLLGVAVLAGVRVVERALGIRGKRRFDSVESDDEDEDAASNER